LVSSEFNRRKDILWRYFHHDRWICKDNDEWEYEYYKGKGNLKELETAINIVFDTDELSILENRWFKNDDNEIIGATIICELYVSADFNGINQGSGGSDCFMAITLARHGFFFNQSQSYEYLLKDLD
jgi:hypothetical protein